MSKPSATVQHGYIFVRSAYDSRQAMKDIPAATWVRESACWRFPATPACARAIRAAVGPLLEADEIFLSMCWAGLADPREVLDWPAEKLGDPVGMKTKGWEHQRRAWAFAFHQHAAMLAMGMGTGKSWVTVALVQSRQHRRTLIVCPKSVMGVWPREFRLHAETPPEIHVMEKGTVQRRCEDAFAAMELALARKRRIVVVVNLDAVHREVFVKFAEGAGFDFLVVDESHRAKDPKGAISNALYQIGRRIPHRLALTGTPMPHSPLDIFAQYRVLDAGVFGDSFQSFKMRYAEMGGYQPSPMMELSHPYIDERGERVRLVVRSGEVRTCLQGEKVSWNPPHIDPRSDALVQRQIHGRGFVKLRDGPKQVVRIKDEADLNEKFHRLAFRVTKAEALDLPEEIWTTRETHLEGEAASLYAQLEEEFYAAIEAGEITIANALVRSIRLRQIVSGHIRPDEADAVVEISKHKEMLLRDVLSDLQGEPVACFTEFRHDLLVMRRVCEDLGLRYGELSGERHDLTPDAKMPDDVDFMGVNYQSGGVGIDLTRAAYAIDFAATWRGGDYEQSRSRLHRPGQKRNVTYIRLVTAGTIEPKVYAALKARQNVVERVMARRGGDDVEG